MARGMQPLEPATDSSGAATDTSSRADEASDAELLEYMQLVEAAQKEALAERRVLGLFPRALRLGVTALGVWRMHRSLRAPGTAAREGMKASRNKHNWRNTWKER